MDAAERGLLASKEGRLDAVTRLLEDPKSVSIARNFATQWLQIRDLPDRTPDPARFPGITRNMLESMQLETILFFDEILREDYPLEELFVADFTFMDDRLARTMAWMLWSSMASRESRSMTWDIEVACSTMPAS